MGKKVEKSFSKDRHSSSAAHQDDDANKNADLDSDSESNKPYKCIGNFLTDFTELCKQNAMSVPPNILLRPKVLTGQSGLVDTKSSRKDDKKQAAAQVHEVTDTETELNEDGEPVEAPPKTFTTKPSFEYFKPSVQVEMDNPEKWDTVTEVYVRGWKIDAPMMETFHQCWITLDRLHTINLWNTGLTEETLHTLATLLLQCPNLINVALDGNIVKEENWSELLTPESLIQNLSLRHCKITEKGAKKIGRALGHAKLCNTKLISLNLSGNFIGDIGAEALAQGLRMNRTLLSLTLMSNNISDKGAVKLAEALSRFPLTHEEIVERRKLMSDKSSPELKSKYFDLNETPESSLISEEPTPSRRGESKDRPGSVRSNSTAEKTKGTKPSAKKKDSKEKDGKEGTKTMKKEDTRDSRGAKSKATIVDASKTMNTKKDKKSIKGRQVITDSENSDATDQQNALLEIGDFMDNQFWIPGNRVLINLNLSRNKIGDEGLASLIRAVQYQTTLSSENKPGAHGLMRLSLQKNVFNPESEVYNKLLETMSQKDPVAKHSVSPSLSK